LSTFTFTFHKNCGKIFFQKHDDENAFFIFINSGGLTRPVYTALQTEFFTETSNICFSILSKSNKIN